MAIDPIYTNVMDKALEIMTDVLRPILNRDVEIGLTTLKDASLEMLKQTFDDEMVMVKAPMSGAIDIDQYYFMSKKLAASITDLMVMGDGTADFNESESLDGVSEATNQIVGAQATQWAEELKTDLTPSGAQSSVVLEKDLDIDLPQFYAAKLKISIDDWGEENICYFASRSLFEVLKALVDPSQVQSQSGEAESGTVTDSGGGEDKSVKRAVFGEFDSEDGSSLNGDIPRNLDLLMDISLPVTIELGRTEMLIRDVLELGPGSVIELQKLSGEPIDLYINDKQFALGEVVVIDENFGIRITELLSVEDRIKALK